jgi:hypothetical protein
MREGSETALSQQSELIKRPDIGESFILVKLRNIWIAAWKGIVFSDNLQSDRAVSWQ